MGRSEIVMGILLDTCAWIWLFQNDPKIAHSACIEKIDEAAARDKLYVASISIWEVGMLTSKKRIELNKSCGDWVREALSQPGLSLAPLSPEIALESSYLPGHFHNDPADRMLVATARHLGLELVTADSKIIEYGRQGFVKVVPV